MIYLPGPADSDEGREGERERKRKRGNTTPQIITLLSPAQISTVIHPAIASSAGILIVLYTCLFAADEICSLSSIIITASVAGYSTRPGSRVSIDLPPRWSASIFISS
jgi:hypothetical protein